MLSIYYIAYFYHKVLLKINIIHKKLYYKKVNYFLNYIFVIIWLDEIKIEDEDENIPKPSSNIITPDEVIL